ncbi:hypothetical protein MNBD_PLANCTO03-759 [hydrothermal vent metagenome]|uniref:4Fe-4S ferredoxin-type domain-containing protein n=1 Tax=hydrothermal vent metagenome TaxID=652676 RepID=A0A3B1DC46_9ZZZZ
MGDGGFSRREAIRGRLLGGLLNTLGESLREVQEGFGVGPKSPPPPLPPPLPSAPSLPVLHRPPGAIEELAFVAQCTRCDACLRACPAEAIVHAEGFFGKAAGTPVIDPKRVACSLCEERSCIVACEAEGTGVLSSLLEPKMGTAMIHPSRCVVYRGDSCEACFDSCPVEGAIYGKGTQPMVDAAVCVGCGMCVQACPVEPGAVSIVPISTRPAKPETPAAG